MPRRDENPKLPMSTAFHWSNTKLTQIEWDQMKHVRKCIEGNLLSTVIAISPGWHLKHSAHEIQVDETKTNKAIVSITSSKSIPFGLLSSREISVECVLSFCRRRESAYGLSVLCTFWFPVKQLNRETNLVWDYYSIKSSRFVDTSTATVASVAPMSLAHISNDSIFDVHAWKNFYASALAATTAAAAMAVMIDCVSFTPSNKFYFTIGSEAEPQKNETFQFGVFRCWEWQLATLCCRHALHRGRKQMTITRNQIIIYLRSHRRNAKCTPLYATTKSFLHVDIVASVVEIVKMWILCDKTVSHIRSICFA